MKDLFRTTLPLYLIVGGIIIIALQNAGIIPVIVFHPITVRGSVDVGNTVSVNLAEVVGTGLVQSKNGMFIGVSSTDNTIIPIHWGEISINR